MDRWGSKNATKKRDVLFERILIRFFILFSYIILHCKTLQLKKLYLIRSNLRM